MPRKVCNSKVSVGGDMSTIAAILSGSGSSPFDER